MLSERIPGGNFNELDSVMSLQDAIAMRLIPKASPLDKFGENPDIDGGSVPEDIWEGGGEYTFSATSDIDRLSSSNSGDQGNLIRIVGIRDPMTSVGEDEGWAELDGQAPVLIYDNPNLTGDPISFWRVYRMSNESESSEAPFSGPGDLIGMCYCFVNSALSGGVPTDSTKIRAVIDNGNNQTLMAIYTCPPKTVAFLRRGEVGMSRSQSSGAAQCAYYSRRYGKVWQVKKRVDVTNQGGSTYQDERTFKDIIPALTDIRIRCEDVSANNCGLQATFDLELWDESVFSPATLAAIGQPGY